MFAQAARKQRDAIRLRTLVLVIIYILLDTPCSSFHITSLQPSKKITVSERCNNESTFCSRLHVLKTPFVLDVHDEVESDSVFTENFSENDDDEDDILIFIDMIEDIPVGELEEDDAMLLPKVMKELSSSGTLEAAESTEKMLWRIVDEFKISVVENKDAPLQPTADLFDMASKSWIDLLDPGNYDVGVAARVISILAEMDTLFRGGLETVKPSAASFNYALLALSKCQTKGIDEKAWHIFNRMKEIGVKPDGSTYHLVTFILAKSRQQIAAEWAEDVLREGIELFPPGSRVENADIGTETFNACLTAWAKSSRDDSPQRCEKLLDFMYEFLDPDVRSFTAVLDAWAQTKTWEGVMASDRMLSRMIDMHLAGELGFDLDVTCWTIVISAWMRLARKNRRGAAQNADKLLHRMENLHQSGRSNVQPDNIVYSTVIKAWAATNEEGALHKADDLFWRMYEKYQEGSDEMKPSVQLFNNMVECWSKSDDLDAMESAENILNELRVVHGDGLDVSDVYRSLIYGWTNKNDAPEADHVLRTMVEEGMSLDSFVFDKVIECWSANGDISSAFSVVELMEQCSRAGRFKPNERLYTSLIRLLVKEHSTGMAKKAQKVLQRMIFLCEQGNKGCTPTKFAYNAVLHACASSSDLDLSEGEKLVAFQIAVSTFNELSNSSGERPDHMTYGHLLRCSLLLPEGKKRTRVATNVFEKCCKDGCFNSYILKDLRLSIPEDVWQTQFGLPNGQVNLNSFPKEWSRSLKRRK